MRKNTLLFGLLMLTGIILISSCKDDEADPQLIGSWKVTGAVFNPPVDTGSGTADFTDAYSMLFQEDCSKDDLFIFEANGVLKNDEGAVKCDTSDPQYTTGSYIYESNVIRIIEGTDTTIFNNANVTKTNLTGTVTFDFGPSNANVDFTMTRQ